jgi:hypothetical protein
VLLTLLAAPIPRPELLLDPALRDAEVLRMPAGSNPSWLSAGQYAAVLARLHPPGTIDRCTPPGSAAARSPGC